MKRFLSLILMMLLHTASAAAQEQSENEGSKPITSTLRSAILNEERRVIIHLPRNYALNATDKYPVMYVLDGTSQDQHTADKITVLADAGLVPDAIVVGIPNTRGNRERDQTPPFMRTSVDDANSPLGGGDKFLAFIEQELIPFIDTNYRTSGYRTLTGNSLVRTSRQLTVSKKTFRDAEKTAVTKKELRKRRIICFIQVCIERQLRVKDL